MNGRARSRRRGITCIALVLVTAWLPGALNAQDEETYQISQRGTVSQKLGHTLVSLDYSRPLVRGRSEIFGKVVHWGELWTPGANQATVLALSHPVKLNGHEVPAGRWSMWIIPSRVGPWELVLDPRDSLFHTERPERTADQVRFTIDTREGEHIEALTWSFPRVAQDGATLLLEWGALEVPLEVEVESIEPPTRIAPEEAGPYVGAWRVEFEKHPDMPPLPPATLNFRYGEDGRLHGAFPPLPPPPGADVAPAVDEATLSPQERERAEAKRALASYGGDGMPYVLVPRALDVFEVGFMEGDVLLETIGIYHEFERENNRIVRLVIRDQNDEVMARGTRVR